MNQNESIFLKAARGERVDRTPVWFMRQAGRALPGYRELRKKYGLIELTQTPELAAQVSLEPINLLGVDAAILFADIMLLPIAMGIDVRIVDNVGPVIDDPIDTPEKIARLQPFVAEKISYLQQTIRILRGELKVPLIGFSGAPFTLASYLIEGKPSRTWTGTKRFMLEEPDAWNKLMSMLSDGIIEYMRTQISAGAQAVQMFDSWVGCLSPAQYRTYILPHMQHIFSSLKNDEASGQVPRIHFAVQTAGILADFSNVDCEVVGVDWRIGLTEAKKVIGGKSIQGNLDPAVLLSSWDTISRTVDSMFEEIDPKQGYIFNLGHGVLPETDDQTLKKLVDYVHGK
jgi:uroporphyrinogen decarboxylase